MSDLVRDVTPLTRAIIWLAPPELKANDTNYKALDYLLDGLLSAAFLQMDSGKSQVFLGNNFNKTLFVLISPSTLLPAELESFLAMMKKELKAEDKIMLVDDQGVSEKILSRLPKDLQGHVTKYT